MKKIRLLLIFLLASWIATAQTVTPITNPHVNILDAAGAPCVGCKLYSYVAGTTTPLPTYTDATGGPQNTNPIILDASGGAFIWMGNSSYKFSLYTADGTLIWTIDQVRGAGSGTIGTVANIAGLRNFPGTGAVNVIGYWSATLNSPPDGGGGVFIDIGAGTSGDDDGGVTIYDATTGHKWRRQVTPSGPMNVQWFGAKGDCTGGGSTVSCTDNTTSIQNAVNAAFAIKGAVLFPSNTTSSAQTVYYIANPVNPKGVSLTGPPGGAGPTNLFPSAQSVAVRGAPSKDVFELDASTTPLLSPTVKDIGIIVDDSVDASSTFTTRRPGRPCMDVAMSSSSGVVTSANQCQFQPGDVGQAVTVAGAGSAGGTLSTTIASWQSATQVTLTDSASTSVTNATTYISVMGLATTQNIGNCAFAYEDPSGSYAGDLPNSMLFERIEINTTSSSGLNNTCGFFFQGNFAPYASRWQHSGIKATWGLSFVPAATGTPSLSLWSGMADFNVWDQDWINTSYPFISYGGGFEKFTNVQLGEMAFGPHILAAYDVSRSSGFGPVNWDIDIPEMENPNQTCSTPVTVFRISGAFHLIRRMSFPACSATNNQTIQWDASYSQVNDMQTVAVGNFNISGNINSFEVTGNSSNQTIAYSNTGVGNTVTTREAGLPQINFQPTRKQYAASYSGSVGAPGPVSLSRGSTVFERTHDFVDKGGAAYYFNSEDLWLWPNEVMASGGLTPTVITDTDSPTGLAIKQIPFPTTGYTYSLIGSNAATWIIGKQFPAGKMRLYFNLRADSNTTTLVRVLANESGVWTDLGCSTNPSVTTSYAVYSCDADATGLTGDAIEIVLGGNIYPTANLYTGWIGVKPWNSDATDTSLQIGLAGTPVTDNQGDGAKLQHSTGSTTTDHLAKFDANGNIVDAGTLCVAATPKTCNSNGCYIKQCDGTIEEWGYSTAASSGTAASLTITFPSAFTATSHLVVTATPFGTPTGDGNPHPATCHIVDSTLTTSGATVIAAIPVQVGGSGYTALNSTVMCAWHALGD